MVQAQGSAFDQRRRQVLDGLAADAGDKSRAGGVDAPIADLIAALNRHPHLFTTSSCSGRITVFAEPCEAMRAAGQKGGEWVYVTHGRADAAELALRVQERMVSGAQLVFRFEAFILAAECRSMQLAQALVAAGRQAGFRESGVTGTQRLMAGLRCSLRLEAPVADGGRLLVPLGYLAYLVAAANAKMQANWDRIKRFHALFREQLLDKEHKSCPAVCSPLQHHLSNGTDGHDPCDANHDQQPAVQQSATAQQCKGRQEAVLDCGRNTEDLVSGGDSTSAAGPHLSWQPLPITPQGTTTEALKRWGHASCLCGAELVTFGGFGGGGTHSRLNDVLMYNTETGLLTKPALQGEAPEPRMGHSVVALGGTVIIYGGRTSPTQPLPDAWALDVKAGAWQQLSTTGPAPPARYRHAAVAVGTAQDTERMVVFGGFDGRMVLSDVWELAHAGGKWLWRVLPCTGTPPIARHSPAACVAGCKMYIHGGATSFGITHSDLHCLDLESGHWSTVEAGGAVPPPRFSHSLTAVGPHLVLVGGSPAVTHGHLYTCSLETQQWRRHAVGLGPNMLPVRHTAGAVGDTLYVIGGGAACFGFGSAFGASSLLTLTEALQQHRFDAASLPHCQDGAGFSTDRLDSHHHSSCSSQTGTPLSSNATHHADLQHPTSDAPQHNGGHMGWALWVPRHSTKAAKDALRAARWLDQGRRSAQINDGAIIALPITLTAAEQHSVEMLGLAEGASLQRMVLAGSSEKAISPGQALRAAAAQLLLASGVTGGRAEELMTQVPAKWERLGDMALLPASCFHSLEWQALGRRLWEAVALALQVKRIARQAAIANTGTRDSRTALLLGQDGWVAHREGGVTFRLDVTACMFSSGNVTERARMARLPCGGQTAVDLYAGIGYYTLPFLVRAGAAKVYACEWNPAALEALRRNLEANGVAARCEVLPGDCRDTAPKGVADRVCLGLLPSSEGGWGTAVAALKPKGGWLHLHHNVTDTEEKGWINATQAAIQELAHSAGRSWKVEVVHKERVKWYAPHIRHLVLDIRCSVQ